MTLPKDSNRLGNVLEWGLAEIADRKLEPRLDLPIGVLRQADRAGLANTFETGGDIDAVAHQIATLSLWPIISDPDRAQRLLFSAATSRDEAVRYHRLLQDESMLGFLDCLALDRVARNQVRSPIHVMGAADDAIVADHEIKATARAYGTEAVVFDDVAHDMMLDPNWRTVADSMIHKLDAQFSEPRLKPRRGRLRSAGPVEVGAAPV